MAPIGLILYHHALLCLGCALVALFWAGDAVPRAIPRPVFLLLGVVTAAVQAFLTIVLFPLSCGCSIYLLGPICFSVLWFLGRGGRRNRQDLKNRRWEAEIVELERALGGSPDNPALYLKKGRLLEDAGLSTEALRTYGEAHELSDRFFSDFELKQAEERLGPASRPRLEAARRRATPRFMAWLPDLRLGWLLCLAAAAPIWRLDPHLCIGALSVWLFVLWCNDEQES